ncbi:MAG: hypothetical protein JZU65_14050, partial [Chlorobium sp.]|nr:hypothetical protein [Chlorobium sp.]
HFLISGSDSACLPDGVAATFCCIKRGLYVLSTRLIMGGQFDWPINAYARRLFLIPKGTVPGA